MFSSFFFLLNVLPKMYTQGNGSRKTISLSLRFLFGKGREIIEMKNTLMVVWGGGLGRTCEGGECSRIYRRDAKSG